MLRRIILSLVALFLAQTSHAFNPTLVSQVAASSITVIMVPIGTAAPTQVDNSTRTLAGRVVMEIQNVDSTANLWCAPRINVAISGALQGRKITPGSSWVLAVASYATANASTSAPGRLNLYCITDAAGVTNAVLTQMY